MKNSVTVQDKYSLLRFVAGNMSVDDPLWEKIKKADEEELKPLIKEVEEYNEEIENMYSIENYIETIDFEKLEKKKQTIKDNLKMVLEW